MRELSQVQGRWWTPDPAGLAAVDPNNPQSWNRYAYVGGTPLSAIDPLGLMTLDKSCLPSARLQNAPNLARPSTTSTDADGEFGPSADGDTRYSGYDFGYSGCAYFGDSFSADGITGMAMGAACGSSGTAMCGMFSPTEDANEAVYTTALNTTWTQYTINDPNPKKSGVEQGQTKNAAIVAAELACKGQGDSAIAACALQLYEQLEAQKDDPLVGGHYNFSYKGLQLPSGSTLEPESFSGCIDQRCGEVDSLHYHPKEQTFHVDSTNPLFPGSLGIYALVHFLVDVVAGHTVLSNGIPTAGPGH
jgi:uncharacterized protein RhaS with RHS repeats